MPMEAVPLSVPGAPSPIALPIATESALQSLIRFREQPRCFPPQSVRFFSLFCKTGFSGRSRSPSRPGQRRVDPTFTSFTQGRLRLHTALRTRKRAPHCRFIICFVHGSAYHNGSTSTHKSRSPRKQVGVSMPLKIALSGKHETRFSQHPPKTGRLKQTPEVSQVCPLEAFRSSPQKRQI